MSDPPIDVARLLDRAMRLLDEAWKALGRPAPPSPPKPPSQARRSPPDLW